MKDGLHRSVHDGVPIAVRREKARISSGCDSRPDNWSLHPEAIGAAAEVTKPSKPSREGGRFGGSASRQAATQVNAVQAAKPPDVEADPVALRGRPPSLETEGLPSRRDTLQGFHRGIGGGMPVERRSDATREASAVGARDPQPTTREGQVGPPEVAERPVRARKPGNAGGAKGPQFRAHGRRSQEPGDWRKPSNSVQRFRGPRRHDRVATHLLTWAASGSALSESRMP